MRFILLLSTLILIGCSGKNGDFVPDVSWTEQDSVGCWAIQLTNQYQGENRMCIAAENNYGGLFLKWNSSLFEFDYPCQFLGVNEIEMSKGKLKVSGKEEAEWTYEEGVLFILREDNNSLFEEVYFPVHMETSELKHLMDIEHHPECEKDSANQYFTDYQRKLFSLHKPRSQMYFNHLNM